LPVIELDEPAVERADEHRVFPQRDAAIDDVAAGITARLTRHFRIVGPEFLAGLRIESRDLAPGFGDVHHAIRHQRRRFQPAHRIGAVFPGHAKLADIRRIDLL